MPCRLSVGRASNPDLPEKQIISNMKEEVKKIKIEDFDYPLPDERIARHPLAVRDECKLLRCDGERRTSHHIFRELPELLPADTLLVCNDTRVINARISFRKPTGALIEVFLLEPVAPADYVLMFQSRGSCRWSCLVGNRKRWKGGDLVKSLDIDGEKVDLHARIVGELPGNACEVEIEWNGESTFASVVDAAGYIPIPPYLKRESEASDNDDYQTVYARIKGSVAAPTAGLHFTPDIFSRLRAKGAEVIPVTLHVGAGTFQPVKSEEIGEHPMHTEVISVSRELVKGVRDALAAGRPVTAVGTTSVRTLESLPWLGRHADTLEVGQWEAYEDESLRAMSDEELLADTLKSLDSLLGRMDREKSNSLTARTSIMIAPGFRWRIVSRMVTNFHQPQSTLLLLVSSFLGDDADGKPVWRRLYDEALANDYRFLSYGDACLFEK